MAQHSVDSKVGEAGIGYDQAVLSTHNKQLTVPVKKAPLRNLQSENNIAAQIGPSNPLVLKETVTKESVKVSASKRPSTEMQMNPHQQSPNKSGANGHLVYVRRKSEGETGKIGNEVVADKTRSQEDGVQIKSVDKDLPKKCLSANAPIPASPAMSVPSAKPSVPVGLGSLDSKLVSEELQTETASSPISLTAEVGNKQNWEERYIQLQMYLKKLDQSSLEEHLQILRSLSAVELSRHAIELEKLAIQLSLEQGKELQRVKALNVLGKSLKPSN